MYFRTNPDTDSNPVFQGDLAIAKLLFNAGWNRFGKKAKHASWDFQALSVTELSNQVG